LSGEEEESGDGMARKHLKVAGVIEREK